MKKSCIPAFLLFLGASLFSQNPDADFLVTYMKTNGLQGTLVLERLSDGKRHVYNERRSKERFLPASTFKVINTLIALEEGVVPDEREIITWDGVRREVSDWNRDQNILTAFPGSCVWFYQELARRIGNETYLRYLKSLNYGNGTTGPRLDSFWLDGDLRISADEQIGVLRNIHKKTYAFSERNYAILREVMVTDRKETYTVRAKTGWVSRVEPQIGWYVGYLETGSDVWFFACNHDIRRPADAAYRDRIVYRAFEELGLLRKKE